jgi:hypothetical protein
MLFDRDVFERYLKGEVTSYAGKKSLEVREVAQGSACAAPPQVNSGDDEDMDDSDSDDSNSDNDDEDSNRGNIENMVRFSLYTHCFYRDLSEFPADCATSICKSAGPGAQQFASGVPAHSRSKQYIHSFNLPRPLRTVYLLPGIRRPARR